MDNVANFLSLEEKKQPNIYRFSAILKDKVDCNILKLSLDKALEKFWEYRVKLKSGIFWYQMRPNNNNPVIEENIVPYRFYKLENTNEYLFKITYYDKKINLDMYHILTDGVGAINFLKEILYNYINIKYGEKHLTYEKTNFENVHDQCIKNADYKLLYNYRKKLDKKAFTIKEKSNYLQNKTYYYIINLNVLKNICKKEKATITEYLSALYIYTLYKTFYNKKTSKDISLTVPVDLRKHYNVKSISNFFTCMQINSYIPKLTDVCFNSILKNIQNEFKIKVNSDNIKKSLAQDVKLGTNVVLGLIPLFIKKLCVKYLSRFINKTTSTISNVGLIKVESQYEEYIDNIRVLVSTGKTQKIKCTICSYQDKLTITINSNLQSNKFENNFSDLLKKHVGDFKFEQE